MKVKALRLILGVITLLAVFTATTSASFACPTPILYQPKVPKSLIIED